jgi:hypothetical protein
MTYPTFNNGDVLPASDLNAIGLWLVKSQTVGTGVSSVTVTGAFSADYDNYRILYFGGSGSVDGDIRMTLGSTAANYYMGFLFAAYTGGAASVAGTNNGSSWQYVGSQRSTTNTVSIDVYNPFASDETSFAGTYMGSKAGSGVGAIAGFLNDTSSYTAFTLTPSSGTLTGGTIRVYGYRN